VVARLRTAILNGRLKPGERLSENILARTMSVSRGPVREALSILEREGLIIVERNRGTFVARLSREDLDEVYSLRRLMEPLAVQLAVQRGEPAHFDAMQSVVDQMKEATRRGITGQESAEMDLAFHTLIYQAAKHKRLLEFWKDLQPQIHILLLARTVADPDFRDMGAAEQHQKILDAIRDKNEEAALQIMVPHIHGSYQRVIRSYAKLNETEEKGNPA
jgi:DNA-binding GntR family transcriptional regulator